MLEYFIPLIGSYFRTGLFAWFFISIFCLAILATIPCIIRELVRLR